MSREELIEKLIQALVDSSDSGKEFLLRYWGANGFEGYNSMTDEELDEHGEIEGDGYELRVILYGK